MNLELGLYDWDAARFVRELLGWEPDEKQALILNSRAHRGILNCTRQWGKSTVTAAMALHRALTRPGTDTLVLAPSERQSAEFLWKAAAFARRLGIKPRGDGKNKTSLLLENRSRLVGLPAREATTRGFSNVTLMLVDEAALVEDAHFEAMMPVLAASNGGLWLMSTPSGRRGFFYKFWEYGGDGWLRVMAPATECSRINAEFLKEERANKSDRMYRQEYLCEFLDHEGAAFAGDLLESAYSDDDALVVDPGGGLREWVERRAGIPKEWYVGLDLGKQRDPSALVVVERVTELLGQNRVTFEWEKRTRYVVRHAEQFRLGTEYRVVAQRVARLLASEGLYGKKELVVDATGVGAAVVEMLREHAGRWGLMTPVVITGGEKEGSSGGVWHVAKAGLVAAVELLLESGELRIARQAGCAELLGKQLRDLEVMEGKTRKWRARGAAHDDLALALALACWRAGLGKVGPRAERLWW